MPLFDVQMIIELVFKLNAQDQEAAQNEALRWTEPDQDNWSVHHLLGWRVESALSELVEVIAYPDNSLINEEGVYQEVEPPTYQALLQLWKQHHIWMPSTDSITTGHWEPINFNSSNPIDSQNQNTIVQNNNPTTQNVETIFQENKTISDTPLLDELYALQLKKLEERPLELFLDDEDLPSYFDDDASCFLDGNSPY